MDGRCAREEMILMGVYGVYVTIISIQNLWPSAAFPEVDELLDGQEDPGGHWIQTMLLMVLFSSAAADGFSLRLCPKYVERCLLFASLLLVQHALVELKFLTLQDVAIASAALTRAG